MGQGYTRTDTINNIADGNIINAADFDAEYDAIESSFNSSTGHSHDGTSGEGGPVTVLGPAQDFVASTTDIKPKTNNTLDIGTTGLKFKNLFIQGTANLPTVDIDAGAIDGAIVGANSAAAGTFTNLTASTNLTLASGATVTAILDEDNLVSASDTAIATQQSIKAYVDSQIAGNNELSEILANGNITAGTGIDLIDNDKIRFGTGNDLEIFHNASDSIINDAGTGSLKLQQGGATKLEVTSTGVTVADDLVVNDDVSLSSDGAIINLGANSEVGTGIEFSTETAASTIETGGVIESVAAGLTPTAEEFDMIFKTMSSGATAAERLKLNGSGATIGNINVDGNTIISTDTNGNINLSPNGTGTVVVNTDLDIDNININGNTIISTNLNGNIALTPNGTGEVDISKVDIAAGEIDGTIIGANSAAAGTFAALEGTTVTASTNLTLASGATVTAILDEDNMATNSATALATQQSIRAYVTSQLGAASNVSDTGITFDGSTTGDSVTTTLAITDPTSNRTFTFADESGTVSTQAFANGAAVALAIALG